MSHALPVGRVEERFKESKPLYTAGEAVTEANRCLYCADAPCIKACPTDIDIPAFIRKIATGNIQGAAKTIFDSNLLGDSCGRVCPVEVLCAGDCVYNAWDRPPIQIGRLQRYATETALKSRPINSIYKHKPATGNKIALVGAGPASITAAGLLALEGHKAVIFERKHVPGGLNSLGIAPYKMLGSEAIAEIDRIMTLGDIELKTGVEIAGQTAARLLKDYDAIFLGIGLGADSMLPAIPPGQGVVGAVELIERIKSRQRVQELEGVRRAVIIGGGNTAIDIAHELVLLGVPDVVMLYRRSAKEMSGYGHEMDYARRDGVRLIENCTPLEALRDGEGRCFGLKADFGQVFQADLFVLAVGQHRMTELASFFPGVEVDGQGRVVVDANTHRTGNAKVWSGGDCVNGGKEVVNAVQHGKIAARDIHETLTKLDKQSAQDTLVENLHG